MEFIPTNGTTKMTVNLSNLEDVGNIDHSSAHESGQSHTVLQPRSRGKSIIAQGVPLKDLHTAKFLWTLILRDMSLSRVIETPNKNDYIIDQPDNLNNLIIDIFALPDGVVKFETDMFVERAGTVLNLGVHLAKFKGFNIFIFARGTDQFKESPNQTVKISGQDDWVPFVTSITKELIELEIRHVEFKEMEGTPSSND